MCLLIAVQIPLMSNEEELSPPDWGSLPVWEGKDKSPEDEFLKLGQIKCCLCEICNHCNFYHDCKAQNATYSTSLSKGLKLLDSLCNGVVHMKCCLSRQKGGV